MAFSTGYCTVTYANRVNLNSEWLDYTTNQKELAISMGRSYIDKNYTCADSADWDITDLDTIPEEIQLANAKLAGLYSTGELTTKDVTETSGPVTKKMVKAGSVETETTYLGYYSQKTKYSDPNEEITLMISAYCSLGNSSKDLTRV